jgi:hypothetical protein
MKREIRFRAWEFDNNGGKLVYCYESYICEALQNAYPLMQFTGLHDENGIEIYESDIVNTVYGSLVVEWNDDCCKWQYSNGMDINDGKMYGMSKWVIGNIYENPELVKIKDIPSI